MHIKTLISFAACENKVNFVAQWFCYLPSEITIKRESGANPEQSRCCMFRYT